LENHKERVWKTFKYLSWLLYHWTSVIKVYLQAGNQVLNLPKSQEKMYPLGPDFQYK